MTAPQVHRLDPYAAGPLALGSDPVVDRVDPMWRSSPTPYGPVALVALRAVAVLDVGLTGSVLLLRLLAVVGVAAAVAGALLLSAPERRPLVLALAVADPVTLLHLVGGAHLDALVAGLVTLALLAWRSERSWSALLLAAHDAQLTGDWHRLKVCRNDACGTAFYDRSRNSSAVWHDAVKCGNAPNLRASRARRRAPGAAPA